MACGTAPVRSALKDIHCMGGKEEYTCNSDPFQQMSNGYVAPIKSLEANPKLDGKRLLPCY